MSWSTFYLICFVTGFLLSFVSVLSGSIRMPHAHGGFAGMHGHAGGPLAHGGTGAMHATHAAVAQATATQGPMSLARGIGSTLLSFFNFAGITAFLAWFGGTGYLLTRYAVTGTLVALTFAVILGFVGAGIIFYFLTTVLLPHDKCLDPADYEMAGVLATVNTPIHAGGTGEIVFSQAGTRHCAGARSEDGSAIARGAEVVVTRYERGIAYVRRWEEFTQ